MCVMGACGECCVCDACLVGGMDMRMRMHMHVRMCMNTHVHSHLMWSHSALYAMSSM
jgi:hypothetical protein